MNPELNSDRHTGLLDVTLGSPGALALLCLVSASFLVSSVLVPKTLGYLATAGIFGVICLWLVSTGDLKIIAPKRVLGLYLAVLGMLILSTILNPSLAGIARIVAFSVVTTVIVFSLVPVVDLVTFWRWYAIVTAAIVIVGMPTLLMDVVSIGPIDITTWGTTPTAPIDLPVNTITSLFTNPNTLALVCCFAIIGLVTTQPLSGLTAVLASINVVGVVAADGQAAQLATIAGLGIFAVGRLSKRPGVVVVTSLALGAIIAGLLMVFQLLPGPETLATLDLNGRRDLWTASAQAIQLRPIVGYGLIDISVVLEPYLVGSLQFGAGPHNSFLRVTLVGGMIAGVAYVSLFVYALIQGARTPGALASHAALWAAVILQLFDGATLFGLSPSSVMFAIALGWSLRELSGSA